MSDADPLRFLPNCLSDPLMMTRNEIEPVPNQDPTQDNFLMRLRTKNQNAESHRKTVESYDQFFIDRSSLENNEEAVKKRREGSDVLTNHFYNLVTDFYEYGTFLIFRS